MKAYFPSSTTSMPRDECLGLLHSIDDNLFALIKNGLAPSTTQKDLAEHLRKWSSDLASHINEPIKSWAQEFADRVREMVSYPLQPIE